MRLSELPEGLRVKLNEDGERRLWSEIDDRGGIKEFCRDTNFDANDLYNWRSSDIFYPAVFVAEILGDTGGHVLALKGGGRSLPARRPDFPLEPGKELLTRIDCSVKVNREGVPFYRARESSLVERFSQLLSRLGDVPVSVYRRSGYELRYPKYIHDVLRERDFEADFGALVDETGKIESGELRAGGISVPVKEFDGALYSREKRFQLAIERGDSEEVSRILGEEREKVSDALL